MPLHESVDGNALMEGVAAKHEQPEVEEVQAYW